MVNEEKLAELLTQWGTETRRALKLAVLTSSSNDAALGALQGAAALLRAFTGTQHIGAV